MTAQDLASRFQRIDVDQAPGQHRAGNDAELLVDFSHGDVDAFPPPPGTGRLMTESLRAGARSAYSVYRGHAAIREGVASRLAPLLRSQPDPGSELIITPGTQAALYLALSALVDRGDPIAIVTPDYFANRKIPEFIGASPLSVPLDAPRDGPATLRLDVLESAFRTGARVLVLSHPNNPTGAVYDASQLAAIAELAERHDAIVIADQLYSRLVYDGAALAPLRGMPGMAERSVTLIGPSKTESLSGFRLGVAVGPAWVIDRMERLQAIVSLRAPGYAQGILSAWLAEPEGWLAERTAAHQRIRDRLVAAFDAAGLVVRPSEAGSYLFPLLPELTLRTEDFIAELRRTAGVVVTPGSEFGTGHDRRVRLNFSQDADAAAEGVARLIDLAGRRRA